MKLKWVVKHIKKRRDINNQDGSYAVEASIILPAFLVAVITIGCICSILTIYENIIYAAVDESRYAMITSYVSKTDLLLPSRLENRMESENKNINNEDVFGLRSGYKKDGYDNLMGFQFAYDIHIKAPLPILNNTSKRGKMIFRKFVGTKGSANAFSFDRMEKDEAGNIVYIFPNDGEKYHKEDCSYVKPKATAVILSDKIRKEYNHCPICKTDKAKNGTTVYIFTAYGDTFHFKNCNTIKKQIMEIDREQAEKKGYSPCSKCGG